MYVVALVLIRVVYSLADAMKMRIVLQENVMRKLIVILCLLAMGSTTMAYFEDFESYTPAIIGANGYAITNPGTYDDVLDAGFTDEVTNAYISTGLGSNSSNVVEVWGNAWARLDLAPADRFVAGTMSLDFTMRSKYADPGPDGHSSLHLYMADSAYPGGSLVNVQIIQAAGVGSAAGYDVLDITNGTTLATDVATRIDGWHSLSIDFDADALTYDIFLDATPIGSGIAFLGFQFELTRISIINDNNYVMQWDNLSVTPEPATMALLCLGSLMLRRRKKVVAS